MLKSVNLEREKKNESSTERNDVRKITIETPAQKSVRFEHNIPEPTRSAKMPKKKLINLQHNIINPFQGTDERNHQINS